MTHYMSICFSLWLFVPLISFFFLIYLLVLTVLFTFMSSCWAIFSDSSYLSDLSVGLSVYFAVSFPNCLFACPLFLSVDQSFYFPIWLFFCLADLLIDLSVCLLIFLCDYFTVCVTVLFACLTMSFFLISYKTLFFKSFKKHALKRKKYIRIL